MSERAGSVRDARHLSGADIGRTITFTEAQRTFTGTLSGVVHTKGQGVVIWLNRDHDQVHAKLDPHDAVTITGAP